MAVITWTHVTNFADEMSAVGADAQTDILATVNTWFDADLFALGEADPQLKMCRILLAAHLGSCVGLPSSSGGGSGGSGGTTITSESGGDGLSVSYGSAALVTASDQLSESAYGRQLDMIRPSAARGPWVL